MTTPEYNGEVAPVCDVSMEVAEARFDERLRMAEWATMDEDTLEEWLILVLREGGERERKMILAKMTAPLGKKAVDGGYGTQSVAEYVAGCIVSGFPQIIDDLMSDR